MGEKMTNVVMMLGGLGALFLCVLGAAWAVSKLVARVFETKWRRACAAIFGGVCFGLFLYGHLLGLKSGGVNWFAAVLDLALYAVPLFLGWRLGQGRPQPCFLRRHHYLLPLLIGIALASAVYGYWQLNRCVVSVHNDSTHSLKKMVVLLNQGKTYPLGDLMAGERRTIAVSPQGEGSVCIRWEGYSPRKNIWFCHRRPMERAALEGRFFGWLSDERSRSNRNRISHGCAKAWTHWPADAYGSHLCRLNNVAYRRPVP